MSSGKFKSMRFILPGIFLLVLGAGNIGVGVFKGKQYEEVLQELSVLRPSPALVTSSPLKRIQVAKQTATRLHQRESKARARIDFYHLVEYGGKVFITLSMFLLFFGSMLHGLEFRKHRRDKRELREASAV